jgi:hypothetical protein
MAYSFRLFTSKPFLVGAMSGAVLTAIAGAGLFWWVNQRSAQDEVLYDKCLVMHEGNRVACDAIMRQVARARAAQTAMK